MRSARSLTALVALALMTPLGCQGGASGPQLGGQTNWLRVCRSDAECGDALSCFCGACTAPCSEDAACGELPGTSCVPPSDSSAVAFCGGAVPAAGACLARCEPGGCGAGARCVSGVCEPLPTLSGSVTVDRDVPAGTLVGFGAGVSYLDDQLATHPESTSLFDALFLDLGLDVLRFRNRHDPTGAPALENTAALIGAATARLGRKPLVLLVSASPPASMKANGSTICSGNPDTCTLAELPGGSFDYAALGAHWRASLEAYAAVGITPDYVSIQNDPDWVPPPSAFIEACRFLPTEGVDTVQVGGVAVEVTYPGYVEALAAVTDALVGLPAPPRLLAPDTTSAAVTPSYVEALTPGSVDAIGYHLYDLDPEDVDRGPLTRLGEQASTAGLPLFQTEMSADGLGTAVAIHEAMTTGGSTAYVHGGLAGVDAFDDGNELVLLTEESFELRDTFHTLRHFARFTDPGWVRLDATSTDARALVSAWRSPDGATLTFVLVNPTVDVLALQLPLADGAAAGSRVVRTTFDGEERSAELGAIPSDGVVRLPARSLVTVVAPE